MKVYISCDMEGASAVVDQCQVDPNCKEYEFGQKMQLYDVLAGVEGAILAGAREIIINDAHHNMTNLDISNFRKLKTPIKVISGNTKPLGMIEGTEGCDCAFFLCYHAMAGTANAILDHTIDPNVVYSVSLNGVECGEILLNASVCAQNSIPVCLVTGDEACCLETQNQLGPDVQTVAVKTARGRMAAEYSTLDATYGAIRDAAEKAVRNLLKNPTPPTQAPKGPFTLDLTFHHSHQCDNASVIPTVQRTGARTVQVTGQDMLQMRRWLSALISLGGNHQ